MTALSLQGQLDKVLLALGRNVEPRLLGGNKALRPHEVSGKQHGLLKPCCLKQLAMMQGQPGDVVLAPSRVASGPQRALGPQEVSGKHDEALLSEASCR